jgi:hypothetical protein
MTTHQWYHDIRKVLPDFNPLSFRWLLKLEAWQSPNGLCCRLLLNYADRFEITLVAKGVRELPRFKPATMPGVLPYIPYDLGEFLIFDQPDQKRMVVADESNGWMMVADSISFENIADHVVGADGEEKGISTFN